MFRQVNPLRDRGQRRSRNSSGRPARRYKFGKELGRGGSGLVTEAFDTMTNVTVACKRLRKEKERFHKIQNELFLMRGLNHPNIIKFLDLLETPDEVIIVMPMAKGGELFNVLKNNGPFDEQSAKQLILGVLKAVAYMHERAIVHRDIKLENVLIAKAVKKRSGVPLFSEDDVILADLGLSKKLSSPDTIRTMSNCGSHYYLAPENCKRAAYGVKVDIWAIGVMFFMIMTNQPPFYNSSRMTLQDAIASGSCSYDQTAFNKLPHLREIIKTMLTVDQHQRISAVEALNLPWFSEG